MYTVLAGLGWSKDSDDYPTRYGELKNQNDSAFVFRPIKTRGQLLSYAAGRTRFKLGVDHHDSSQLEALDLHMARCGDVQIGRGEGEACRARRGKRAPHQETPRIMGDAVRRVCGDERASVSHRPRRQRGCSVHERQLVAQTLVEQSTRRHDRGGESRQGSPALRVLGSRRMEQITWSYAFTTEPIRSAASRRIG